MTALKWFDRFPPMVCRLVARDGRGGRGLTSRELAERSGLSLGTVSKLSTARTWEGATLMTVVYFSAACGVDHWRLTGHRRWLKKGGWASVRQAKGAQRRMYERILRGP